MRKITYKEYFDKVYGCWLGKCVSGNVGAPYEGMKQFLSLEYSDKYLKEMLPNDDLDLQVLWLEVLKEKGVNYISDDLADIFEKNCDYAPGEYAFFKKNHRRGLKTPYSGTFNNEYYKNGMGAPIRAEIWACISPLNPENAAIYAEKDAIIDHSADSCSVQGERFIAALESLAFNGGEIADLIKEAQGFVDKRCRLYSLIADSLKWCEELKDVYEVRRKIIKFYGNAEATDCLQNIGFIIASLLLCEGDFIKTTMTAVCCGFDTDCTGATVGAILGILFGAKYLIKKYGFKDVRFKLGVRSGLCYDDVKTLSEETAQVGVYFSETVGNATEIIGYTGERLKIENGKDCFLSVDYNGEPAIGFSETKECKLVIKTIESKRYSVKAESDAPLNARLKKNRCETENGIAEIEFSLKIDEDAVSIPDGLKFRFIINDGETETTQEFGIAAKYQWKIYGPYWKNVVSVPDLKDGESYWDYFRYDTNEKLFDAIRHYHMNSLPDEDTDINSLDERDCKIYEIATDELRFDETERFIGQAVYVLKTSFEAEKDGEIGGIQIGYTDDFEFYLNGKLLSERKGANMYTPENVHLFNVKTREGENEITVKVVVRNGSAKFSYNLLTTGVTSDHLRLNHIKQKYMEEKRK